MHRPATVIAWVIGVPLALTAALPLLVSAGILFESFDDLYGVYRTGDGKTATINVWPASYFRYRDSAGRCIVTVVPSLSTRMIDLSPSRRADQRSPAPHS